MPLPFAGKSSLVLSFSVRANLVFALNFLILISSNRVENIDMTSNTKYNRLLVAVDGSDASLHALREAFKITTSWVTVVAVTPFYEGDLRLLGVPKSDRMIREPCETALAQAQEMADDAGAVIRPVCERGEPHERLVDLAEAGSRDLIVLGARGHSVLENLLVGSVTRRVIGFTGKDILVIPLTGVVGWDKILVATDGSAHSRLAADRALELARSHGSDLVVVSVQDFPAAIRGVAPQERLELLKICRIGIPERDRDHFDFHPGRVPGAYRQLARQRRDARHYQYLRPGRHLL